MISDIMRTAKAFAGTALDAEEEAALARLCEESYIQWGSRLRDGLAPLDCAGAMIPACACSALAALVTLRDATGGELSSFRAGDVSVEQGSAVQSDRAERLLTQAELLMRPYVPDGGFVFRRVRG